ncbi:MAG: hypothetical protein NVS4B3_24700 [Gemmatimonadaceae bacterium]
MRYTMPRPATVMFAAATALAGCTRHTATPSDVLNDDLKHDLELVSSTHMELAAAVGAGLGRQVVSAIESAPLSSRAPAMSKRRRPSPRVAPAETRVAVTETAGEATAPTATVPAPIASAPEPIAPRPVPVQVSYPTRTATEGGGSIGEGDAGSAAGAAIGEIIGAIIRGGSVGRDRCDPRRDGQRPGGILIDHPYPMPPTGRGPIRYVR